MVSRECGRSPDEVEIIRDRSNKFAGIVVSACKRLDLLEKEIWFRLVIVA